MLAFGVKSTGHRSKPFRALQVAIPVVPAKPGGFLIINVRKNNMDDQTLIVKMKTESNAGLGRIYRTLRKMRSREPIGDYILFKRVIRILSRSGFEIPHTSIVRHFKNISTSEYETTEKHQLLEDLALSKR